MSLHYSIYKVQCLLRRSRGELAYYIMHDSICQELFSSFFKFFRGDRSSLRSSFAVQSCPRGQLAYISTHLPICQYLFSSFFDLFFAMKKDPFRGPSPLYIIRYLQSSRSRRHFCDRQQRRHRPCPHPGRQRSYAPADSSAEPLLPGSWA